ncbi:hypothetical protein BDQ12DRAFT_687180 [Crucibulum laeve]|uniref:F-box domain-containing protein n=1 Tax=Crucibulum laeve TaxID=68775 RepID=A0A5C3LU33_9AGAR|nr:hypothetical protein BDQ12DRAFT_687180 [Crucibulum laeve]
MPTEMILEVLQHASNASLLQLALVCRSLHRICLPILFRRARIDNVAGNVRLCTKNIWILPALRMSLDVVSIGTIIWCVTQSGQIFNEVAQLHRVLRKLHYVGDIHIDFGSQAQLLGRRIRQKSIDEWKKAFTAFLETAAQKCMMLHIKDRQDIQVTKPKLCGLVPKFWIRYPELPPSGDSLNRFFTFRRDNRLRARGYRNHRFIRDYTSLLSDPKGDDDDEPMSEKTPFFTITNLKFDSRSLSRAPFIFWTPKFISKLSLTRLEISAEHHPRLLTQLGIDAIPTLQDFTIAHASIDIREIIVFIGLHPLLRAARFRNIYFYSPLEGPGDRYYTLAVGMIGKEIKLFEGCSSLINGLFTKGITLPSLKTLVIEVAEFRGKFEQVDTQFRSCIAQLAHREVQHLTFSFPHRYVYDFHVLAWIKSTVTNSSIALALRALTSVRLLTIDARALLTPQRVEDEVNFPAFLAYWILLFTRVRMINFLGVYSPDQQAMTRRCMHHVASKCYKLSIGVNDELWHIGQNQTREGWALFMSRKTNGSYAVGWWLCLALAHLDADADKCI